MSDWLARQPFQRVAVLSGVWALGLPAAAVVVFRLVMRYARWRHGLVTYRVELHWACVAAVLLLPPFVFLIAWWVTRRAG